MLWRLQYGSLRWSNTDKAVWAMPTLHRGFHKGSQAALQRSTSQTMDPLSIVASVITLSEAVRRIVRLAAQIRTHSKFTKDLKYLIANVELLNHALDAASSTLSSMPLQDTSKLLPIVSESRCILQQIEELVRKCDDDIQHSGSFNVRVRVRGIKRASKAQKLSERLQQVLFGILLFFSVCERYMKIPYDDMTSLLTDQAGFPEKSAA